MMVWSVVVMVGTLVVLAVALPPVMRDMRHFGPEVRSLATGTATGVGSAVRGVGSGARGLGTGIVAAGAAAYHAVANLNHTLARFNHAVADLGRPTRPVGVGAAAHAAPMTVGDARSNAAAPSDAAPSDAVPSDAETALIEGLPVVAAGAGDEREPAWPATGARPTAPLTPGGGVGVIGRQRSSSGAPHLSA